MTDSIETENTKRQILDLVDSSYTKGFHDGQEAVASAFESIKSDDEDISKFYLEVAKIIRSLKIIDTEKDK